MGIGHIRGQWSLVDTVSPLHHTSMRILSSGEVYMPYIAVPPAAC